MTQLHNPHDHFIKELLSDQGTAEDFLQHYLPREVVDLLNIQSSTQVKASFVDEALRSHHTDLIFQVSMAGRKAKNAYIYVLFEHKSYVEVDVPFQLLRYMVRMWEYNLAHGRGFYPILPVLFYHGKQSWTGEHTFGSLFDVPEALKPYLPDYRYWMVDLSRYSDEEIIGEVKLRVGLLILKHIYADDLEARLPGILRMMVEMLEHSRGLQYLATLLRYVAGSGTGLTPQVLGHTMSEAFPQEAGDIMRTIAEQWIEQGRQEGVLQGIQQGLQQGIQQGLQQGQAVGLEQGLQQGEVKGLQRGISLGLELKFGVAGRQLIPEIRLIQDVELLHTISTGLLTATSLEQVRALYLPPLSPTDPIIAPLPPSPPPAEALQAQRTEEPPTAPPPTQGANEPPAVTPPHVQGIETLENPPPPPEASAEIPPGPPDGAS